MAQVEDVDEGDQQIKDPVQTSPSSESSGNNVTKVHEIRGRLKRVIKPTKRCTYYVLEHIRKGKLVNRVESKCFTPRQFYWSITK